MLKVIYADRESVPASDRGLAYGDGLFETMRMSGRQTLLRRYHLGRMVSDAKRIGIKVGYPELDRELARAALQLMPADSADSWVLKMILTRGSGGRGYRPPASPLQHLIFSAAKMPPMPDSAGVVARCSSFPLTVNPWLAGIKTLNRLEQVMASSEFTGKEWELIMPDVNGDLVEGTRTNLLARVGDEWITPPVSSVAVAGVMRQYALECLQTAGESVVERALPAAIGSVAGFRALYLLNSVFGIVPVRSFDADDLPVDDALATICDPIETLE